MLAVEVAAATSLMTKFKQSVVDSPRLQHLILLNLYATWKFEN